MQSLEETPSTAALLLLMLEQVFGAIERHFKSSVFYNK